jgi:hypothetical protein
MDSMSRTVDQRLRRIRLLTALFMLGLILSGVTAIPLETEVRWVREKFFAAGPHSSDRVKALDGWLGRIHEALCDTRVRHPMLFYGTDWLAFGHFAIALAFVGAWRDPVRNRWLFDFGLMACALVVPYALAFGALRGIPLWWRLLDGLFGIGGAVPLWLCRREVRQIERLRSESGIATLAGK